MKKRMIVGALIVAATAQTASVAQAGNADIGGIIGGIIGGLAGHQMGKGNGNTAATIIGAIAGSMIGNKVGAEMDENDRRAVAQAQRQSLNGNLNEDCDWDGRNYGSRTGARGRVVSTREGYNQYTGEYCREYRSTIYLNDRTEDTSGIACSRRDGSWYESQSSRVRWGGQDEDNGYNREERGDRGGRPAPYNPNPYNPAPSRPVPPPPVQSSRQNSVQVSRISRRAGGEVVRVTLSQSIAIDQIEVKALSAGLKIHAATVYTVSGNQVNVREFNETSTFYAGDNAVSERLNLRERVTAIDLRVEGMGGTANILVSVDSNDGYSSLSVNRY